MNVDQEYEQEQPSALTQPRFGGSQNTSFWPTRSYIRIVLQMPSIAYKSHSKAKARMNSKNQNFENQI